MKKLIGLVMMGTAILQYSCLNRCDVDCVNPPSPVWLKVVDRTSLQNLITDGAYNRDTIKIYYFDGAIKKYANISYVGPVGQADIMQTNIGMLQPFEQLNTFYLYLNQHDTDTILVRYAMSSDGCCTAYPLDSIAIDGKQTEVDSEDHTFLIKK